MDWLSDAWPVFLSPALKVVLTLLALEAALLYARRLDTRLGIVWRDQVLPKLLADGQALAHYFGARLIALALLIGLAVHVFAFVLVMPSPAIAAPLIPSTYDRPIKASAEQWLPGVPWRLLKAQLYQESRLDPLARSQVGAEGVGQFMPATWAEVTKAMGLGLVDRRLAEPSIAAAGYYMAQLRKRWTEIRDLDRHRFALASYNAGGGNISRAWRACDKASAWSAAAACLPEITGRHALETTTYVDRSWRWWGQLEAGA